MRHHRDGCLDIDDRTKERIDALKKDAVEDDVAFSLLTTTLTSLRKRNGDASTKGKRRCRETEIGN